jgi:hypothetical protein
MRGELNAARGDYVRGIAQYLTAREEAEKNVRMKQPCVIINQARQTQAPQRQPPLCPATTVTTNFSRGDGPTASGFLTPALGPFAFLLE